MKDVMVSKDAIRIREIAPRTSVTPTQRFSTLFWQHVGWHELVKDKDKDEEDRKYRGKIQVELRYTCAHVLAESAHEVGGTYYKATRGNRVTLYQDADTPQLPQVGTAFT